MSDNCDVTVMVENPAYSLPPQFQKAEKRGSIVVFDTQLSQPNVEMSVINEYPEFEKTGSSSKWDHHISLALVFTIVSVLCLNPFALACGIASIYFAVVARIASRNDEYETKLENERVSFAFAVVCIIAVIVYFSLVGITVYVSFCGLTGRSCRI